MVANGTPRSSAIGLSFSTRSSTSGCMVPHFIAVIPPPCISDALRDVGDSLMVGPHITLKAQPGLNGEDKPKWMARLRQALVHFGEVKVQLRSLASFGDTVAYLEVDSPRIYDLHDVLLKSINPAPEDAARYFELDG
jgi:2'-5' RNA ligase